jgi:hypothetical protein
MSAYSKLLPFGTCLLTKKLGYQRFLLHLQQLLQNSCLDLCMRSVIHQLSLLLKVFSYERYGLVLYSNLDRILFSSFICLLWYDSDYRKDKKKTINTWLLLCIPFKAMFANGRNACCKSFHLHLLCSSLDYGCRSSHCFLSVSMRRKA